MTLQMRNIFFAIILGAIIMPFMAFAQDGFTVSPTPEFGLAGGTEGGNIVEVIEQVIKFFASILAVLAILVIVIAGILYITSAGDESRIESAKKWITYAIIGLIVALLAWVIVNTVASALGTGNAGAEEIV